MGGSGMFLVGERGPELINLGSRADIIPNEFLSRIKSASPRYNVPVNSFGVTSSHTSGGPMNITIQNNITAGPDMNMDQLVRKTTDATMAAFKQITQNNAKMVGPGRNVTVR
jgi:hypothetical protein